MTDYIEMWKAGQPQSRPLTREELASAIVNRKELYDAVQHMKDEEDRYRKYGQFSYHDEEHLRLRRKERHAYAAARIADLLIACTPLLALEVVNIVE